MYLGHVEKYRQVTGERGRGYMIKGVECNFNILGISLMDNGTLVESW